jgi:hypothetical protein
MENYRHTGTCGVAAIRIAAAIFFGLAGVAYADELPVTVAGSDDSASSVSVAPTVGPPEPLLLDKAEATLEYETAAEQDTFVRNADPSQLDFSFGPPDALAPPMDPCSKYNADYDSWLDQSQMGVYRTVCGATSWFDGFFGDWRYDQSSGETFGRISLGEYWDELGGFDTSLRFRARFALPSLKKGAALLIGRGDEDNIIDERDTSGAAQLARKSTDGTDDATAVGLGYRALESLKRQLDFSVGARLSSGLVGLAKIKYRRSWQLTERDLVQLLPLVYWRSDEGLGSTLRVDIDHTINRSFLLRWSNYANISENNDVGQIQDDDPETPDFEIDGVRWGSTVYLFHALSRKRGLTYSLFVNGNSDAGVSYQNAGVDMRYRQRILREWLFIEYSGGVSWPREYSGVERERNFGAGLRLEAYFGPAPEAWML